MQWFSRMKISTKVAFASGLGILLVLGLVGGTFSMLLSVQESVERAGNQLAIARLLTASKEDLQTLRIATRDLRLATTTESVAEAMKAADRELGIFTEHANEAASLMLSQENRDRAARLVDQTNLYHVKIAELGKLVESEIAANVGVGVVTPQRAALVDAMAEVAAIATGIGEEAIDVATKRAADEDLATESLINQVLLISAILGIMVLAVLGFSLAFILRSVAAPIRAITGNMSSLADGKLDETIPYTERADEIGQMAAAVRVFQVNAIKVRDLNDAEAIRTGQTRERAASMTKLMDGLAGAVNAAVAGDFTQRIALSVPDEDLKAVAKNVNDLLATVDAGVSETGEVLAALAQTDLTQRMQGEYRGAFAKLKADTNAVVDNLSAVVGQLRHTSSGLKTATGEILSGANDLAERTTKQAAAIEETSAAMEQLSTTVVENAKRAEQASSKAQSVSDTAALTGEVMTKSNAAMERISTSSAKISNIIGLIDDIAFQTNLLALNASVEAARAGDAGKGFAVVAVEVRRLAQSAASASSEVKVLIEQSAGEVSSGSKLVAEATQKLGDMLGSVKESADLIKDISSASREQSSAIAEVSTAIRQMDEMTQHNAALVEQTNAAIEQTESQANELDTIVDRFVIDQHTSRAAATVQAARPAAHAAPATGIKGLQQKVKAAASSYLSKGNAALKEEWSEF
ncbi:MAG: methyl-accepting chemotaxis protein [Devosia sp.]|nr:methyl-accepting chemotaxis protein [Devosia sp.]